ncbi:MAG: S46 family peptidase [Bacteroidota bacterium]
MTFRLALFAAAALGLAACGTPRMTTEAPAPEVPVVEAPAPAPEAERAAPEVEQPALAHVASAMDTVRAGRFDNGRMFTLDAPPHDYFRETYGFAPGDDWYERARLGALRFATYCSASFVSETGLILTNHHCARQSVTQASLAAGTDYNEDGFFADGRDEEVLIDDLFVEQLIDIRDVTDEVNTAASTAEDAAARQAAIAAAIQAIEAAGADEDAGTRVQVISLYSGGQYKAYTFKRYDNIRLVFAPETKLGYFGGDPDNFTYPRYSLDFSLFRAVDEAGNPLDIETFFPFEPEGSDTGDLVFVIGNPGSTSRLQTVAELEYRRDVSEPALLNFLQTRERAFGDYVAANPDAPETPELTDTYFSLGNGRKAYTGRVEGLRDDYILARRAAAQRDYQEALRGNAEAQAAYGSVVDDIAANRESALASAGQARAFMAFSPTSPYNGTLVNRALTVVMSSGAPTEAQLLGVTQQPVALQQSLLAARLADFDAHLPAADAQAILVGRSPEDAARAIVQGSALATEAGIRDAMASGADLSQDPAVRMAQIVLPMLQAYGAEQQRLGTELAELQTKLALGRFAVYGTEQPPDATFSLRISDGVVKSYDYNGTMAPTYTTFFGLYDRYYSFCQPSEGVSTDDCSWDLPQRWLDARSRLTLSTPYNFISSNDIIGGNSGSPILNRDLEVVGIAFDGNIESLPGNYIYLDTYNRTVSVDVRAMLESLRSVYGLTWIVDELVD